jgi:hypothetical protein
MQNTQPEIAILARSFHHPITGPYRRINNWAVIPAELNVALCRPTCPPKVSLASSGCWSTERYPAGVYRAAMAAPRSLAASLLAGVQDVQIEPCVGNGLLKVTVEEKPQVLLHFSNELTERFALAAHYLRQRIDRGVDSSRPRFFQRWSALPLLRSAPAGPLAQGLPELHQARPGDAPPVADGQRPIWGLGIVHFWPHAGRV